MKYIKYLPIPIVIIITINVYGKSIAGYMGWIDSDLESDITAPISDTGVYVIAQDDPILYALDSIANAPYFSLCSSCEYETEEYRKTLKDTAARVSEKVIKERLALLNHSTPFKLVYNSEVKAYIDMYAYTRRFTTAKVLGLADIYFPIFEELLDKYHLPLEFKYLAVVESALNPSAKSGVGAMGLWQFMLTTGKIYDLDVTSFEDQRCDPYKSTEAACKYFKYLYDIYQDWELVLAAYNCGPGNVNKAIRRSGYKKNYWQLWPYLPKETRGYVPAFIAVNYIMSYSREHNIIPAKPITAFFNFDTLKVNDRISLDIIAENLDIDPKLLKVLNPSYKLGVIPKTGDLHTLCLPVNKIGLFIENEKKIIAYSKEGSYHSNPSDEIEITHYVVSNETLSKICSVYGTSKKDIIKWNNLKDTVLTVQQKLIVGFVNRKDTVLAKAYIPEPKKKENT